MATEDIKHFLEQQTNIPEKQWKRIAKSKNTNGDEIRIFEDKISGKIVHTIEKKDGSISIVAPDENNEQVNNKSEPSVNTFSSSQLRAAKKLIQQFLEEGKEPEEKRSGFSAIPSFFNFSFLEDANCDWTKKLKEMSASHNPNISVAGLNIFISLKDSSLSESSCVHLQPLLYQFLPNFLNETEEATFSIEKDSPIAYNQFVATLEQKGFSYEKKHCALANLGGSQGASPLVPPNLDDIKPQFSLLAIKQVSWEDPNPIQFDLLTGLVIEHPSLKTRKQKEKFINNTLKKYICHYPGRLSNGNIPQLNIVQLIKKSSVLIKTDANDRLTIFNLLIKEGWKLDLTLATLDKVKDWDCEDWTLEPFSNQTEYHNYLATRKDIAYFIWQPGMEDTK